MTRSLPLALALAVLSIAEALRRNRPAARHANTHAKANARHQAGYADR